MSVQFNYGVRSSISKCQSLVINCIQTTIHFYKLLDLRPLCFTIHHFQIRNNRNNSLQECWKFTEQSGSCMSFCFVFALKMWYYLCLLVCFFVLMLTYNWIYNTMELQYNITFISIVTSLLSMLTVFPNLLEQIMENLFYF